MIHPSRSTSRLDAFRHAFAGWWHVIRTQRNAWIHAAASMGVIILGLALDIAPLEWAIIFIAMGLVWMAEFINSALEAIVDLASPEIHPLARAGKDVGAAAVLIAALAAASAGLIILGPPLWQRLSSGLWR
jgi:diacylglycerol kinase (ATP)